MRIHKFLEKKYRLFYLFPIYILISVLLISLIFSYNKNKTDSKIEIKEESISPEIKVKFSDGNIKEVSLEEYLIGVVSAEMPPSFETEALKAQAVAARTYILHKQGTDNSAHKDADVCTDPSHCKAYISESDATAKWGEDWINIYKNKISEAVKGTQGEIVTYENEPIIAVFHSTSNGKTENSEDVWQTETPYLKSVLSEGEELSPRFKSTKECSFEEFKKMVTELNSEVCFEDDKTKWITEYTYTEGGSVNTVNIGGCRFKGTDIRTKFNLRSANFNIELTDRVTFYVTGNGHGVGMSQYGANYAASMGSNYKEILAKYYLNTQIQKAY